MSGLAFRVDADVSRALKRISNMKTAVRERITVQAINKTGTTVRSRVVKDIAAKTGSKQKTVREKIALVKAFRRSTGKRMFATVVASRHVTNLIEYVRPSQRKPNYFNAKVGKGKSKRYRSPGVVATAWGQQKTYKGTFIGRNGAGQMRVYRRTSRARDKITLVSGPSFQATFQKAETHELMRRIARERFPIEFDRALNNYLRRQR